MPNHLRDHLNEFTETRSTTRVERVVNVHQKSKNLWRGTEMKGTNFETTSQRCQQVFVGRVFLKRSIERFTEATEADCQTRVGLPPNVVIRLGLHHPCFPSDAFTHASHFEASHVCGLDGGLLARVELMSDYVSPTLGKGMPSVVLVVVVNEPLNTTLGTHLKGM